MVPMASCSSSDEATASESGVGRRIKPGGLFSVAVGIVRVACPLDKAGGASDDIYGLYVSNLYFMMVSNKTFTCSEVS